MNTGAFGENFPYTNFHDLNMDWIIKIAKDFLDQYTNIQQVIQTGLDDLAESRETGLADLAESRETGLAELNQKTLDGLADLQEKYDNLESLLQAWYNTHSADIAEQLATAIADFNASAEAKSQALLDSWPADYSELVTGYNNLKSALNALAIEHKNLATPDFTPKTMNISNNEGAVAVSDAFPLVSGHRYFVYAKVKITNLSSWTSGLMYAWLFNAIDAGTVGDSVPSIENNGEYVLSGNITANASGSVKVNVLCNNQTPSTNQFTVTLEKLFVIESSNNLKDICNNTNQADYLVEKVNIPYKTITPDMIADSVLADVKQDIEDIQDNVTRIADIKENILTPITTVIPVSIVSGECETTLSDIKTISASESYFVYCKFKITNLSSWTSGLIYLRLLHGIDAGGWSQMSISSMENNGEYELYYNVTPSSTGTIKAQLYFNQQTPSTNSFNVTVEKLFLVKSSENLKTECQKAEQGNKLLVDFNIPNESITPQMLSSDALIPITDTSIVDCWGDSLTAGNGTASYPAKLQTLIGNTKTVNNYGQGAEVAEAIAFRQGAINGIVEPFTVGALEVNVTVPAMKSVDGKSLATLNMQGLYYGNDRVFINGSEFMYRRKDEDECYFINVEAGNVGTVYTRPMLVQAQGRGTHHIIIICMGQNGYGTGDPEELANLLHLMVEHNNSPYYLILGIPTGNTSNMTALETILATRFGNHFINTREYISTYGLSDNSITPTTEDTEAMAIGAIPPSLRVDNVHLNEYGYIAMANCIYARGVSLGYW